MKKISIISLLILVLSLGLTVPVAADTSTPPDRGQPSGNPMQTQLDNLVSSAVITADQEKAITEALKPSEGETRPSQGQDMSVLLKSKLDSLVTTGTITQVQEEAVLTACQPPSGGPSSHAGGDKGILGSSGSTSPATSTNGIVLKIGSSKIMVKGTEKDIDPGYQTSPLIKNGRTFIPIRTVIESLGGTVQWLDSDQSLTITLNGSTVVLKIGQKTATVNGTTKEIDGAPFLSDTGRTMLPIRFIAENLGLTVNWDDATQTITIS
ncbi:MAG TPA: copper amine oxidase N-terminal domain-containing protein [Syntrophomonadaceae bacterium]|nr:copper amine oxidase N-terminal domain-containing protein [Syntrophomonadaceae bacterium]